MLVSWVLSALPSSCGIVILSVAHDPLSATKLVLSKFVFAPSNTNVPFPTCSLLCVGFVRFVHELLYVLAIAGL